MSTSGKQIYHTNILRLFLSDYFQQFNISVFSKKNIEVMIEKACGGQ